MVYVGVRDVLLTNEIVGPTRELLARSKIDCPTIIRAGTGTFEFETASGVYTELQCGSYIFTDADYGRNRDRDGAPTKAFVCGRQPPRADLADHRQGGGVLMFVSSANAQPW